MGLTKFVRNVRDLSDDGGYKFRFHCDQCGDGFESQYVAASANLLKTAVDVFGMFRPFGGSGARRVADSIDRGLRGKERDKAYESAVHKAMHFFKKCNGCGKWVCPQSCWNAKFGMCESCAPDAQEEAAKVSARRHAQQSVSQVEAAEAPPPIKSQSCPVCSQSVSGGKFCEHCGANLIPIRACSGCGHTSEPNAKFCVQCGVKLS